MMAVFPSDHETVNETVKYKAPKNQYSTCADAEYEAFKTASKKYFDKGKAIEIKLVSCQDGNALTTYSKIRS